MFWLWTCKKHVKISLAFGLRSSQRQVGSLPPCEIRRMANQLGTIIGCSNRTPKIRYDSQKKNFCENFLNCLFSGVRYANEFLRRVLLGASLWPTYTNLRFAYSQGIADLWGFIFKFQVRSRSASRVSGRGNRIGPVCLCVCLSALSRLNRLTYHLDFCHES